MKYSWLILTLVLGSTKSPISLVRTFKKANWTRFQPLTNGWMKDYVLFNVNSAIDNCTVIMACVNVYIPKNERKKYSPLWSKELQLLESRDKAENMADSTGLMKDCIEHRK
ncbi:hypothetical protein TNCT_121661 [Trichonephila clavata]|uniref:Lipocalin n=1 Tax=Trichonephila clavata TaxID=2740835 RepID=A0A8X6H9P5_TRICU|nr:hypothetical protein TNCT_121661 [Trichonephila clavata]